MLVTCLLFFYVKKEPLFSKKSCSLIATLFLLLSSGNLVDELLEHKNTDNEQERKTHTLTHTTHNQVIKHFLVYFSDSPLQELETYICIVYFNLTKFSKVQSYRASEATNVSVLKQAASTSSNTAEVAVGGREKMKICFDQKFSTQR